MLDIKNLSFSYGRKAPTVLGGLSLSLGRGEIGILLGRNGVGKSTLFSIILGIEKPRSGEISLDGKNLLSMSGRERAKVVSYVPQSFVFGSLSVFDTVLTGRLSSFGLAPSDEDKAAVRKALDEMGLWHLKDRYADTLSGGEKQKLAIARAIVSDPDLIVFDEPTSNLDPRSIELTLREVGRLSKEKGITVLLSMHDLTSALTLGDRFFFMKDGKITASLQKNEVNAEIINDTFGINCKIVEIENQKIVLGGKYE